jgi:hypothetical protein
MEGNTIAAGRIAAFRALPDHLEVEARGNHFMFRDTFVSFVGFGWPDSWRRMTVWRGQDNTFEGSGAWLRIDGQPLAVHDLNSWRALWESRSELHRASSGHSAVTWRDPWF